MKLKDILDNYEFYFYDKNMPGALSQNCRTVRVYLSPLEQQFFEIGFGSLSCSTSDVPKPKEILLQKLLERDVSQFYADPDMGILMIVLEDEDGKDED